MAMAGKTRRVVPRSDLLGSSDGMPALGPQGCANVVLRLDSARRGETRFTGLSQIPEGVRVLKDRKRWHNIPQLLRCLHENSEPHNINYRTCMDTLNELHDLLNPEGMDMAPADGAPSQPAKFVNSDIFDMFGGVELVVEIIMRPSLLPHVKLHRRIQDYLTKTALETLHCACIYTEGVARRLSERSDFVTFLFSLLSEKRAYLQATAVMEDVLCAKKEMVLLEEVPDLVRLVSKLDQHQFANFCRAVSIMVSELESSGDDNHTLLAQNEQQRRHAGPSSADLNQSTLLNIPGFVKRLCELATQKAPTSSNSLTFLQELEHLITWMEMAPLNTLLEEDGETNDLVLQFEGQVRDALPQSMRAMHEVICKVEVLYVLIVLLTGKRRDQVHKLLSQFQLIPGLNDLFDELIWKESAQPLPLHNCDCNPEVALNIQFLRLLHSFSDHHENKYLLLNKEELSELSTIAASENIPESKALQDIDRLLVCRGEKGLLKKLIEVMKNKPPSSAFRFWLARAVESFLRGETSFVDQMFLLNLGLLEHIVSCIIDNESCKRDILQSNFDLLGELMKFNVKAFRKFYKCVATEERFGVFMQQLNSSLVDSNMFIRCVALSLERFLGKLDNFEVFDVMTSCRLLTFMASIDNQLSFLIRLIGIVRVEILTQENVSCLNTSLVFLMLASRKGELPVYLNALREKEYAQNKPGYILGNFHSLLRFWKSHYLSKDKDSTSLENSSSICFEHWKETVELLLSPDRQASHSLFGYIDEAYIEMEDTDLPFHLTHERTCTADNTDAICGDKLF
uniref:short transient receptor potential channel 4-associated protein isoform X2 n=1 Tax=Myxine glutinosa TaxID=7769 RepID=UPI00358EE955